MMVIPKGQDAPTAHPTAQAQYVLYTLLNNYRLSPNPDLLLRAQRNLDRMLSYAVDYGDGLFFPFEVDFNLHRLPDEPRRAPWYSALSQGQALSAFCRYYSIVNDPRHLEIAHDIFRSLLIPFTDEDTPGVTMVDSEGYLWLEEYPGVRPDHTFNGLVFAMFGVYDYWDLTQDPEAFRILQGVAATIVRHYPTIRNPGHLSRYCVSHIVRSASYHRHHTDQMMWLYTLTRDTRFARMADELFLDYPVPTRAKPIDVVLQPGEHLLYEITSTSGLPLACVQRVTLDASIWTRSTFVERMPLFSGRMIRIDEGPYANLYVQESYGHAWARGFCSQRLAYNPHRTVTLRPGIQQLFRYSADGKITEKRRESHSYPRQFKVSQQAIINARPHVQLADVGHEGWWAVLDESASLN